MRPSAGGQAGSDRESVDEPDGASEGTEAEVGIGEATSGPCKGAAGGNATRPVVCYVLALR